MARREMVEVTASEIEFLKLDEFREGDLIVEGEYLGVVTRPGTDGPFDNLKFRRNDGKLIEVKATTQLQAKMDNVSIGGYVEIEYDGKIKLGGGKTCHTFKVFADSTGVRKPGKPVSKESDDSRSSRRSSRDEEDSRTSRRSSSRDEDDSRTSRRSSRDEDDSRVSRRSSRDSEPEETHRPRSSPRTSGRNPL